MGDERGYWIAFSRVGGIGAVRVKALLDNFGSLKAAWRASPAELNRVGLGPQTLEALLSNREKIDPEREIGQVVDRGFSVLTWEDDTYPARLREIAQPPPVLYVWGQPKASDRLAVAVVGTRRPTSYGQAVAREVAAGLAANGLAVISGLARGIDALAHKAALEAGGRTIAVLGSGLDQVYPPEHRLLAEQVAASGVVYTDYPMGTRPEANNFPPRNRIISGLAMVVVIVEAGQTSGAMITADFAADQGRDVFAVPGNITSKASGGTNRLIANGARPMLAVEDILEALNLDALARGEAAERALPEDPTERQVWDALSSDPIHVDDLGARCGLSPSSVMSCLAMLELKGRARQVGGMNYVRAREARAMYRVD
jgi:DNA processing protein